MRAFPRLLGVALIAAATTAASALAAHRLTPLAVRPDWSRLQAYQYTITRAEFLRLINDIYSPDGSFWKYSQLGNDRILIFSDTLKTEPLAVVHFAPDDASQRPLPIDYCPHARRRAPATKERPLEGLRIALDPGHIGGDWATLEERHFQINGGPPVEEAELNSITCQRLAEKLHALGATVTWSKLHNQPATALRPAQLRDVAIQSIATSGGNWPLAASEPAKILGQIDERANSLFFRTAEIRARAATLWSQQPDLTLCVHYNAAAWDNPKNPQLLAQSRLVTFINGAYSTEELSYDDQKFEMLLKLLGRTAALEQRGAQHIARQLAERLNMPAETYANWPAVKKVGSVPGVFARNLLANRSFPGPVIFIEGPYMNARDAYYWLIAGDYEGKKEINASRRPSLYREMADAIAAGVVRYASCN